MTLLGGILLNTVHEIQVHIENIVPLIQHTHHFLFDTADLELLQSGEFPDAVVDVNNVIPTPQLLSFLLTEPFELLLPARAAALQASENLMLCENRKMSRRVDEAKVHGFCHQLKSWFCDGW